MTRQEIQQLARQHTTEFYNEYCETELPNCLANEVIDMIFNDAESILTWLNRDHCIVSREKVCDIYNSAICQEDVSQSTENQYGLGWARGIKNVLETLFGKETFEERSEE